MRRYTPLALLVFTAILIVSGITACGPRGEPIQPGDTVGVVTITTGTASDYPAPGSLDCTKQGDKAIYACVAAVGRRLNISIGVYDNNFILTDDDEFAGLDLDKRWEEHTYELLIDNRPVDLEAFGWLDMEHPTYGFMRLWNVVIVAGEPGEVTLHGKGEANGQPFEITQTITFSAAK